MQSIYRVRDSTVQRGKFANEDEENTCRKNERDEEVVEKLSMIIVEDVVSDEDKGLKTAQDFVKESGMIRLKNAVLLDVLEKVEENEQELLQRIIKLEERLRIKKRK